MNGFKTYIITKKTLIKFGIILSLIISLIIFLIILMSKAENSDTVTAFSHNAENILDKGVISDNDSLTAKKVVNSILGFDTDDPVSIIENSGKEFESPSPAPTITVIYLITFNNKTNHTIFCVFYRIRKYIGKY